MVRLEKDDLKAQLEEAVRKRDEVSPSRRSYHNIGQISTTYCIVSPITPSGVSSSGQALESSNSMMILISSGM